MNTFILHFILFLFCFTVFPCRCLADDALKPIQIRVNINAVPDKEIVRQAETLHYLSQLYTKNHVRAGFWLNGAAYQQLKTHDPSLVKGLYEMGFHIAHHGANRGGRGESLVEKTAELTWENSLQMALEFERQVDKGGLEQMQQDFHNNILVTGRFFRAPILQATKLLGCESMIGLKDQLKAPTNAAWYMGMLSMPDGVTVTPDDIRNVSRSGDNVAQVFSGLIQKWAPGPNETISIVIHDYDFRKGSESDQQQFRKAYEILIALIASNKKFETVTYREIKSRLVDARTQQITMAQLFDAANQLIGARNIPLSISVGSADFSSADILQAFTMALSQFVKRGMFPAKVQPNELLGPTRVPEPISAATVNVKTMVSALASWLDLDNGYIPPTFRINNQEIPSSSLLIAMGEVFVATYRENIIPINIQVNNIPIFPAYTEGCSDTLSRLQFWTYKPHRSLIGTANHEMIASVPSSTKSRLLATPIYVTVYSHNEEDGPWALLESSAELYAQYRSHLIQKVRLIHERGAALSWQTDYSVLRAMLRHEKGHLLQETNNKSVLRWIAEDMGVEVAPHGHLSKYNYADLADLISQLGVTPAPVIGGFALYHCAPGQDPPYVQRNWPQELEIQSDGVICGRNSPSVNWRPRILVQPAMIGHVFDEFSSGVWRTDLSSYMLDHKENGPFIVIGQGYPHYTENLGRHHAGGSPVRASSGQYIRDLAMKIQADPVMHGMIYTASIHTVDYPMLGNVSTYAGLKKSLDDISGLVQESQVIFMNYSDIASLWMDRYNGSANRYRIERTPLYETLYVDLKKYCQDTPPKPMHSRGTDMAKCGDGICDEHESRHGVCVKDCPSGDRPLNSARSGDSRERSGGLGAPDPGLLHKCGDGICDELEKSRGMCPQDCK